MCQQAQVLDTVDKYCTFSCPFFSMYNELYVEVKAPVGFCLVKIQKQKFRIHFSTFWFFVFSLQPVRDTREKQVQLWKELILDYCKTQKIFVIQLEDDFPLFTNPAIESKGCLLISFFFVYIFYQFARRRKSCVPDQL